MKKIFIAFAFLLLIKNALSQDASIRTTSLSLSTGKVAFGTGDVVGYSISAGVSKQINKESRPALNRLLLGGELFFENGVNVVTTETVAGQTGIFGTFRQISNSLLWSKISYYPFRRILPGLHVQVGPTAGYSLRSSEGRSWITQNIFGDPEKYSAIINENGYTIGYRISAGLDFSLTHRVVFGVRGDFSNNNLAEINSFAGIKTAISL